MGILRKSAKFSEIFVKNFNVRHPSPFGAVSPTLNEESFSEPFSSFLCPYFQQFPIIIGTPLAIRVTQKRLVLWPNS
jgi:hypothetical protein